MGKDKLRKFRENETFKNVIEPRFEDAFQKDHPLKGNWNSQIFNNQNPIVLELGCGKGEYSVGLAKTFSEKNYIGIDIKGARIWRGAKTAIEIGLTNVVFLRTRIEFIESYFEPDEVSEIWITFPDPQKEFHRRKKRLTSAKFLNRYRTFLKKNGVVHLKTDSDLLYNYTLETLVYNGSLVNVSTNDLYSSEHQNLTLGIKTHYEELYLKKNKKINYLQFQLNKTDDYVETPGNQ